jgi:hypothetical protein
MALVVRVKIYLAAKCISNGTILTVGSISLELTAAGMIKQSSQPNLSSPVSIHDCISPQRDQVIITNVERTAARRTVQ